MIPYKHKSKFYWKFKCIPSEHFFIYFYIFLYIFAIFCVIPKLILKSLICCHFCCLFSNWVFFHGKWRFTEQHGNKGDNLFSSLPLPPVQEHWGLYLQFCIWDVYLVYLIAAHVIASLLLDETYPPQLVSVWLNLEILSDLWYNATCYYLINLSLKHCGTEFASTATLVLQI